MRENLKDSQVMMKIDLLRFTFCVSLMMIILIILFLLIRRFGSVIYKSDKI